MRIAMTLVAMAVVFCVGCVNPPAPTPTDDLDLTEANNGEIYNIETGTTVTVTLEENGSTGYQWKIYHSPSPTFALLDNEYIAPTSGLEGAPGKRVFTLLAINPGDAMIGFGYFAPGDYADEDADEVWQVNIDVSGDPIESPVVQLDEEDNGTTIVVSHPGDIVITLDENPSTGCQWEIIDDGDPAVEVTTFAYVPHEDDEMVGQGGERKIWLQTLASGTATFEVGYCCLGAETPDETFTITILIE